MRPTTRRLEPLLRHPVREAIVAAAGRSRCFAVGGVVRDLLLFERLGHDWDLVAFGARGLARRLAERLPGRLVRLGGDRHDLYRVVAGRLQIDLQEPLENDLGRELLRRDLTVNSIAFDLRRGMLHDPLDGGTDIERRLLRANTDGAFAADPLRVLRLLRFAATLPDFTIEARSAELARRAAPRLEEVAAERVRDELHQILSSQHLPRLGSLLDELEPVGAVWRARDGVPRRSRRFAALDRLDAELRAVASASGTPPDPADREAVRHAAALALASPGAAGGDGPRRLFERGFVTRRLARRIERLARPGGELPAPPADEPARRRLIHGWSRSWPAGVALQTWLATGATREAWRRSLAELAATARRGGEALLEPPALLTGDQLEAELGLPPGPEMGRRLDELRRAQVDGAISTAAEARDWLRRRGSAGDRGAAGGEGAPGGGSPT